MAKSMKPNLASYLVSSRTAAGLSQKEVSEKLGYSTPQFISNWERGVSHPPIDALKKLAQMYNISADSLFEAILDQTVDDVTKDLRRKFDSSRSK